MKKLKTQAFYVCFDDNKIKGRKTGVKFSIVLLIFENSLHILISLQVHLIVCEYKSKDNWSIFEFHCKLIWGAANATRKAIDSPLNWAVNSSGESCQCISKGN